MLAELRISYLPQFQSRHQHIKIFSVRYRTLQLGQIRWDTEKQVCTYESQYAKYSSELLDSIKGFMVSLQNGNESILEELQEEAQNR